MEMFSDYYVKCGWTKLVLSVEQSNQLFDLKITQDPKWLQIQDWLDTEVGSLNYKKLSARTWVFREEGYALQFKLMWT